MIKKYKKNSTSPNAYNVHDHMDTWRGDGVEDKKTSREASRKVLVSRIRGVL
jgi:hypothetical protein